MRILSFILELIGSIIYLFLPIILGISIACIFSENIVPGINPVIRHTICIFLFLIMLGFSIFCTLKRNSAGETRKVGKLFSNPKLILGILFVIAIFSALMIQQKIYIMYVALFIIGFIAICVLAYRYMRNSMDYESEYLIGLWCMTAFAFYVIGFA